MLQKLHSTAVHQSHTTLYPCPCCGYLTFHEPPPGTYLVCPICFWEDTSGLPALGKAQRNFLEFGACDRQYIHQVRPPTHEDQRTPNWQPLEALINAARSSVMADIVAAFDGVQRQDGVTLHEALENDYWGGPFHPHPEARKQDTEARWQEIPDEWIETCYLGWHYLDRTGWKYYLPAFMLYVLKHSATGSSNAIDVTIFTLTLPADEQLRANRLSYFECLTVQQSQAICQFLRLVAWYEILYGNGDTAQKALDDYWRKFCTRTTLTAESYFPAPRTH